MKRYDELLHAKIDNLVEMNKNIEKNLTKIYKRRKENIKKVLYPFKKLIHTK